MAKSFPPRHSHFRLGNIHNLRKRALRAHRAPQATNIVREPVVPCNLFREGGFSARGATLRERSTLILIEQGAKGLCLLRGTAFLRPPTLHPWHPCDVESERLFPRTLLRVRRCRDARDWPACAHHSRRTRVHHFHMVGGAPVDLELLRDTTPNSPMARHTSMASAEEARTTNGQVNFEEYP